MHEIVHNIYINWETKNFFVHKYLFELLSCSKPKNAQLFKAVWNNFILIYCFVTCSQIFISDIYWLFAAVNKLKLILNVVSTIIIYTLLNLYQHVYIFLVQNFSCNNNYCLSYNARQIHHKQINISRKKQFWYFCIQILPKFYICYSFYWISILNIFPILSNCFDT